MGLRDLFPGRHHHEFEPQEAVLGLLVAAARADGVLLGPERDALDAALGATGLFEHLSRAELDALGERVQSVCGDHWDRFLPDLARGVPPELRVRVYSLCADLVVADGILSKAESHLLERIREPLGLSHLQADQLLAAAASRRILHPPEPPTD